MKVKKSQELLSASWIPKKAGGVVQRPESQRTNVIDFSLKTEEPGELRAGKHRCSSSAIRQRETKYSLPPPFLFYSVSQGIG